MNKCMLTTVLGIALTSAAVAITPPTTQKKVIGFGWDTMKRTPAELADHADQLAEMGLDGVGVSLARHDTNGIPTGASYGSTVYSPEIAFDGADIMKNVAPLRRLCAHPKLNANFVITTLFFKQRVPFEDDKWWDGCFSNLVYFARVAKQGGAKGLLVDVEDYGGAGQFYWHPMQCKHSYKDTLRYARRRGRQYAETICREFPDAHILTTWLLSNQSRKSYQDLYNGPLNRAVHQGDLFIPFVEGLIEGLAPEAVLIDGDEAGYYLEYRRREFFYEYFAIRKLALGVLDPALHDKYTRQVQVGFGLYLDCYTNPEGSGWYKEPEGGSRLGHLDLNMNQALEVADEYVWIWGEHYSFAAWSNTVSKAHIYATWESQLPGLGQTIKFLKNPKGYGEELLAARLANGGELTRVSSPTALGKPKEVADELDGIKIIPAATPAGWVPDHQKRANENPPVYETLPKGGRSGGIALKMAGGRNPGCRLPGCKVETNAVYMAEIHVKGRGASLAAMHLRAEGAERENWMSMICKHADGDGIQAFTGEPDEDGWRKATVFFRAEPYDKMFSLAFRCVGRLADDETVLVSDYAIYMISE